MNYLNDPFDILQNFTTLAKQFCINYYTTFDNNPQNLAHLYKADSKITFINNNYLGFNNLYYDIVNVYNIVKFNHQILSFDVHPVGRNTMYILVIGDVTGQVQGDYNIIPKKFVESFIIQRDIQSNKFYIYNSIFKLL